jgi:hypothetical protein
LNEKKLCVKNFLLCLVSRDDSTFISCLTSLLYIFSSPFCSVSSYFPCQPSGVPLPHMKMLLLPLLISVTRVNFVYKNKVNIYKNNKFNFFISFTLLIVSVRFEILSCMITATAALLPITYVKFTSNLVSFKCE